MIYGLYLSATGVLANSHRQDVIANNLANVESVGFKRDLAVFQEQRTEASLRGLSPAIHSNRVLEGIGGGMKVAPTFVDHSPGELEQTGNPLDVAIQGSGYFRVQDQNETLLTRDGRFTVNGQGYLALAGGGKMVLDDKGSPIKLPPGGVSSIERDGAVNQNGQMVARVGLFDVPQDAKLTKRGDAMFAYAQSRPLRPADGVLRSGFVERSNAEPTTQLSALLDAQRQLEANANLIRYQDQTLGRLVNDVGKIG
jgi:flagellar basal-body rod protein FlgF